MMALTLIRPWNVLVSKGIKKIENRTWGPGNRLREGEWFAIHAGNKFDPDCIPFAQELGVTIDAFDSRCVETKGAIVAVCLYAGCVTRSEDPWFFGPYGWVLEEVAAIDPVECKGGQGLWAVSGPIVERVRENFRRVRARGMEASDTLDANPSRESSPTDATFGHQRTDTSD